MREVLISLQASRNSIIRWRMLCFRSDSPRTLAKRNIGRSTMGLGQRTGVGVSGVPLVKHTKVRLYKYEVEVDRGLVL